MLNKLFLFIFIALQVIKNNLNPRWKAFQIPVQQICNGDYDRTIQVSKRHDCLFFLDFFNFIKNKNYIQYEFMESVCDF